MTTPIALEEASRPVSDHALAIDIRRTFADLVVYDHAGGRPWSCRVPAAAREWRLEATSC